MFEPRRAGVLAGSDRSAPGARPVRGREARVPSEAVGEAHRRVADRVAARFDAAGHAAGEAGVAVGFIDNPAAIALYEKHGFRIEGEAPDYALRDGAYASVFQMARIKGRQ